ncbi:MAG: homocysteine S-methyltransferase [Solirubrobacteraceae bacterium]
MTGFAAAVARGIVVLDGGLGTLLEAQGNDLRDSLWSARLLRDAPDEIVKAHRAFFDAGADVAITAGYHASYAGFAGAGIDEGETTRLLALSVKLARRAQPADRETFVAGSVGLYGVVWADGTEYTGDYRRATDEQIAAEQRRRIRALVDGGADLLAIETIPSGREAAILAELLSEVPGVDTIVSFCCRDGRRLSDGTPIGDAVRAVTRTGHVTAVGVNCTPPQYVESLLRESRAATDLPLVAYPNWGRAWDSARREWVQGTGVVQFADELLDRWYAAGARVIGGCCGIGPAGIAGISRWRAARRPARAPSAG